MENKPLIFITNDDGVEATGIKCLIEAVKDLGEIVVVAPEKNNSGQGHSITFSVPLTYRKVREEEGITVYAVNGTPVDCVKLGLQHIVDRKPDYLVSGINHGSNTSINVFYSGTMAGVIEGCLHGIPSVGFSLVDYSAELDFEASIKISRKIFTQIIANGIAPDVCLNVNIPKGKEDDIKGIKNCRHTRGRWNEFFDKREHPHGHDYFWLAGEFENFEPKAEDTDHWAIDNQYVAVVPVSIDFTDLKMLKELNSWKY